MFINPDGFDRKEIGRICSNLGWALLGLSFVADAFGIPSFSFCLLAILFSLTAAFLAVTNYFDF